MVFGRKEVSKALSSTELLGLQLYLKSEFYDTPEATFTIDITVYVASSAIRKAIMEIGVAHKWICWVGSDGFSILHCLFY